MIIIHNDKELDDAIVELDNLIDNLKGEDRLSEKMIELSSAIYEYESKHEPDPEEDGTRDV